MSGHSADPDKQRPVLSGGSQHGPESTPGQFSGKHGTMGRRTPEPGGRPRKPAPGSKGGNPTYRDQSPTTYNATSASRTTRMEKPHPANQHQRPLSPLTTSAGKPTTSEPRNETPTAEAPGATHNTRDEAAIGATQTSHIPEATSARAQGRARREPPLNTTRMVRRTPLGPAIRTTSTARQTPPLSLATQESRTYDYHAGPRMASGRRSGTGLTGPTGPTRTGQYCQTKNEKPRNLRREGFDFLQSVVGSRYHVPRILPRDKRPPENRVIRNAPDRHGQSLAPQPVLRPR